MPDAEYEWWIDQKVRDPDGTLFVIRLLHYGPFRNEKAAERQIDELKRMERYRRVILVPSKQRNRIRTLIECVGVSELRQRELLVRPSPPTTSSPQKWCTHSHPTSPAAQATRPLP